MVFRHIEFVLDTRNVYSGYDNMMMMMMTTCQLSGIGLTFPILEPVLGSLITVSEVVPLS